MKRIVALVLISILFLMSACSKEDLKSTAKKAYRISITLESIRSVNRTLFDNKLITGQEATTNLRLIEDTARIDRELINVVDDFVKQLDVSTDETSKKAILQQAKIKTREIIKRFLTALDNLNLNGVLKVKNEVAQQQLSLLIASIKATI